MDREVLIHVQDICKTFGPTKAVDGVTMDINKGEIRGLIGENGSGKSTLVSMIAGILPMTSGSMLLEGEAYHPHNQVEANNHGINIILQEMTTLPGLTVADNIFFGHEEMFIKYGIRDIKRMNREAAKYLKEYGLGFIDPSKEVSSYNFEQRKLIELIKAFYTNPKLVIIDETTTALSHDGRMELYKLMKSTKERGGTIVFISHDLQEVLTMCDTITVFRDGHFIDTLKNEGLTEGDLKSAMVGRVLNDKFYRDDYGVMLSDKVVLEVKGVSVPDQLKDVSFDLHEGEILGIGGLSESGLHEIGKAIFGASHHRTGSVKLKQKNIEIKGVKQAIREGIGYVSKNRDTEALINHASIKDNVCISCMDQLSKKGFISPGLERKFADKNVRKLNLKMESVDQFVSALSGGNKQKVALTKWLSRESEILVMDSPTRGIDVVVKAAIYELMTELKAQGKSIIMISEEMMELLGMSDRILVFKDGEIAGEFERSKELCEDKIIQKMI